jgi:long-subunit fatty acid transport protein
MKYAKSIGLILTATIAIGQNELDVLRYTDTDFFGSARTEAMAGSFGALGADFSAMQINPAGMGRFSSSHFAFSLSNISTRATGTYNDQELLHTTNTTKVNTIGKVFTGDVSRENNGKVFRQFSLGYTRLRNFEMERRYEGQNFNSLIEVFAAEGDGIPMENFEIFDERPFSTGLGLDAGVIEFDPISVTYLPILTDGDMYHERSIRTEGGIGEWHLGISENYLNKLYYGVSLGIRRVRYKEFVRHRETLLEPEDVTLRYFDYFNDLEAVGRGWNIKAGFIYLPHESLRFGLAYESPTQLRFEEKFSADMIGYHTFGTVEIPEDFKPRGSFDYRMRTPMKVRGSGAFIFENRGAVNIDLEFLDYGRGKLRPAANAFMGSYDFAFENEDIRAVLRPTLNLRVGGELKITQEIFIRGGLALLPQPFNKDISTISGLNKTFAIGLGYEKNKINLDISFRSFNFNEDYYAFDPSQLQNLTTFRTWVNVVAFSLAYRI